MLSYSSQLSEQKSASEKSTADQKESSLPSSPKSTQDRIIKSTKSEHCFNASSQSADIIDNTKPDLDISDALEKRPMSPGTLALMCDEQDTMFLAVPSPNGLMGTGVSNSLSSKGERVTKVYMEQERLVLTTVRDCLNKLITVGEIKGQSFLAIEFRIIYEKDH